MIFWTSQKTGAKLNLKEVLWLCGNSLRTLLTQHDAVKDDPEPHYSKLPPAVAEALRHPGVECIRAERPRFGALMRRGWDLKNKSKF
jgi:hypothetical protein